MMTVIEIKRLIFDEILFDKGFTCIILFNLHSKPKDASKGLIQVTTSFIQPAIQSKPEPTL